MTHSCDVGRPTRRQVALFVAAATVIVATPAFADPLALLGQSTAGRPVTPDDPGGWRIVYFGYTHCPDVCPTGLQTIAEAIDALGPIGHSITPVFVTVDPARDTVEVMRDYVAFFHPRLIGVIPTDDELRIMGKAWRIKYAKVDVPGHDYLMDHTATDILIDPNGEAAGRFSHSLPPDKLAEKIRGVLEARAR